MLKGADKERMHGSMDWYYQWFVINETEELGYNVWGDRIIKLQVIEFVIGNSSIHSINALWLDTLSTVEILFSLTNKTQ